MIMDPNYEVVIEFHHHILNIGKLMMTLNYTYVLLSSSPNRTPRTNKHK
jgi:hypothetical protein